jgi:hypothetical protein
MPTFLSCVIGMRTALLSRSTRLFRTLKRRSRRNGSSAQGRLTFSSRPRSALAVLLVQQRFVTRDEADARAIFNSVPKAAQLQELKIPAGAGLGRLCSKDGARACLWKRGQAGALTSKLLDGNRTRVSGARMITLSLRPALLKL